MLGMEVENVVGVLVGEQGHGDGVRHGQPGHASPEGALCLRDRRVADHRRVVHEDQLQAAVQVVDTVHGDPRVLGRRRILDAGQFGEPLVVHVAVVFVVVVVEHAPQAGGGALLAPLPQ